MKNKLSLIISALLCATLMTGCGSSEKANIAYSDDYNYADSAEDNYSEEYAPEAEMNSDTEKKQQTESGAVKKEMLVYSGNLTVDVLDFDNALKAFKNNVDTYGAFVEKENYSDSGSTGHWQYADEEKWKTYTGTIRVPSSDFDNFCDAAAELGDLRSKNTNVENLSREYYDLSSELEIYKAKEKRYMDLIAEIEDEKYAISVEEELTNIQIAISKLQTRMNDIQTDVAYSFVNVTIKEVKEYTEEPVRTDTFLDRLSNTLSNSGKSFLNFLEGLLFLLIYVVPYLLVLGLIVFILIKIIKFIVKKSDEKRMKKFTAAQQQNIPVIQPQQAVYPSPQQKTDEKAENKTDDSKK